MFDSDKENPDPHDFDLMTSAGICCDACGGWVPSEWRFVVRVDGDHGCSAECAAELGHTVGAGIARVDEDSVGPGGHRYDLVSLFAAAGMT